MREILIILICRIGLVKFLIGRADFREISRNFSKFLVHLIARAGFREISRIFTRPSSHKLALCVWVWGISYRSALQWFCWSENTCAFDSELNFEKFRESSPDSVLISQLSVFGSRGNLNTQLNFATRPWIYSWILPQDPKYSWILKFL